MLDFAWPELVVIGAVALVAIGPKDLPKAMYNLGKWAGKARSFAHDLHRAFEQVSYEAEIVERMKAEKHNQASSGASSSPPPPPPPSDPAPADHHAPPHE